MTTKTIFRKLRTLPLATLGVSALVLMTAVLALSFILGIDSNAPLWVSLALMAAGVAMTVAGLRKSYVKKQ